MKVPAKASLPVPRLLLHVALYVAPVERIMVWEVRCSKAHAFPLSRR